MWRLGRLETWTQQRRSKLGGVGGWTVDDKRRESGKHARESERLLHEETLARRGVRLAGRRLFLDLAQAEFKYFGYQMRQISESVGWKQLSAGG